MQINKVKVICIGSALVDTIASSPRQIDWGDDVPGYITSNVGGVAFNICQQLALSQFKEVELLTALGKDAKGRKIIKLCDKLGIITKNAKILNEVSAWINSFDIQIKNEIIYLIQYEQLVSKGIDAKGKVIGLYKPFTEQLNPLKKAGEHYTLLDTGEFFKSIFIDVMRDSIIINGNGKKDNEMKQEMIPDNAPQSPSEE
ncbi:MAG: hypothetical protein EBX05_08585 [Rhodobacteraceae bacterium]|nr:hypothetical protein [Paracoccaceae bacterium]